MKAMFFSLRSLALFMALGILIGLASSVAPLFNHSSYLPVHALLEMVSILISFMIFYIGWSTYRKDFPGNILGFSCLFLVVGLIDFVHMFSYNGMPDFVTPSNPHKAIIFWLFARWIAAMALLMFTTFPLQKPIEKGKRAAVFILCLSLTSAVYGVGLFREEWIPDTLIEGVGLTTFKLASEISIAGIHLANLILILLVTNSSRQYNQRKMILAIVIMIFSELCFMFYTNVTDNLNALGHLYKVIAYSFVYLSVFHESVQIPHRRLVQSEIEQRNANNRLMTTLNSIYDAVIITDAYDHIEFMNPKAQTLTGWTLAEAERQPLYKIFRIKEFQSPPPLNKLTSRMEQNLILEKRDGDIVYIDFSSAPIDRKDGHRIGQVVVFRDITERREAEQTRDRLISILEATTDFIAITTPDGRAIYFNEAARSMFGHNLLPRKVKILMAEEDVSEAPRNGVWKGESELIDLSGKRIPVSQVILSHKDKDGNLEFYSTIARDITDIKEAHEQELLKSKVFESISEGIMVTDTQQKIIYVNPAFTKLTGYAPEDIVGLTPRVLSSGWHKRDFFDRMWSSLKKEEHWTGEIWNKRKDGSVFLEEISISVVKDQHSQITHYVGIFNDITLRKQLEAQVEYQAHHDALTGLPNRILLMDRMVQAFQYAQRKAHKVAVLFIDLDRFKHINDTLGHTIGDSLLKSVGERMIACLRASDTVARIGGDELIVLLPDTRDESDGLKTAEKIMRSLNQPFTIEGHELLVSASIGISLFPDHGVDPEELIKLADHAMYRAKQEGRDNVRLFMQGEAPTEKLALETSLRKAIERDEFVIFYQPQIAPATGRTVGMEALVRWAHPVRGLVPPSEFIPLAEETGLILQLDQLVLRKACHQSKKWLEKGLPPIPVSVNLSMLQFQQTTLHATISNILYESRLSPDLLEIELTESTIMRKPELTLRTLSKLREMGVHISLDDFGTGYSSLSYLKQFPINTLKIDKSFINDIHFNPSDLVIAKAIIQLAHHLQLKVIAEGVETEEQANKLKEFDCDLIQGFYYSRPMPEMEFEQWMLDRMTRTG